MREPRDGNLRCQKDINPIIVTHFDKINLIDKANDRGVQYKKISTFILSRDREFHVRQSTARAEPR